MKSFLKNPFKVISLQIIIVLVILLIFLYSFKKLPNEIPLWYTHRWGFKQLAKPMSLFIIPLLAFTFFSINYLLIKRIEKAREREILNITKITTSVVLLILLLSLIRIIYISTNIIPPFNYDLLVLAPPLIVSFIISAFFTPFVIKLMKKFNIMDDPKTHKHPAILHSSPIPRGGSISFFLSMLISSLIFIALTKKITGILLGAASATIIGVIDDKIDIKNANLKFFLLLIPVLFIVGSGIGIAFFTNPLNGIVRLDTIDIPVNFMGEHHILLLADLFALFWLIWVMGMLGISDGIDGQFSGIIAIASITISILALRFVSFEPQQLDVAKLGSITAGASLGLLLFNWYPAKIHWGTGDWSASLIVGSLGILSGAKVATSILVLLVPSMDALVTVGRRVLQKRSPFTGDRAHLHHRLLDLGWDQKSISIFYWFLTLILGFFALFSSGKTKLLSILTLGGLILFLLILINLRGEGYKLKELVFGLKYPKKESREPGSNFESHS